MAWGFGGARGELGRRLGVEVRAAAMASGSGVAVLASARPDGDAMGGASINVADAAEEGGDGTAWRGRVALGVRELRSWRTWTRLGLCVWMIPPLVVTIISISQLILIKVIITWVVTRGSAMRSRQVLDTHLNRQRDLKGTRERISTSGSSGSPATASPLLGLSTMLAPGGRGEGGRASTLEIRRRGG